MRKVPSLYQEKKSILMKENWELMPKWICTNKPKITLAVQWLSCVHLLAIQWTAAYQAPLSMGFSRQEYWSGVPLPSPIHRSHHSKKEDPKKWLGLRAYILVNKEFVER